MPVQRRVSKLVSITLAAGLLLSAAPSASATPGSNLSGDVAGGTTVTLGVAGTTGVDLSVGELTFTDLAAGQYFSVALDTEGDAWTWGRALLSGSSVTTPVRVTMPIENGNPVRFSAVDAGWQYVLALSDTGKVYAWGQGGAAMQYTAVPQEVGLGLGGGVTVKQIAAGSDFALALDSTGTVHSWGANDLGQAGHGSDDPMQPVAPGVVGSGSISGKTIVQVAAGFKHALALDDQGAIHAWGGGQGGNGTSGSTPATVSTAGCLLNEEATIAAGGFFSLALTESGTVCAWGQNGSGQLGIAGWPSAPVPVTALNENPVEQVDAGLESSYALDGAGIAHAWGRNEAGRLGNGTTTDAASPILVATGALPSGVHLDQISGGDAHAIALGSNGVAYGWGFNQYGAVGDGTTTTRLTPVAVAMAPTVTGVDFGGVAGTLTTTRSGWSVATPAHAAGAVDITIHYTQLGEPRTRTVSNGFTYTTSSPSGGQSSTPPPQEPSGGQSSTPPPQEPTVPTTAFARAYFAPHSSKLTSKAKAKLKKAYTTAATGTITTAKVTGYAKTSHYKSMATKRANAVIKYLKSLGLTVKPTKKAAKGAKGDIGRTAKVTFSFTTAG